MKTNEGRMAAARPGAPAHSGNASQTLASAGAQDMHTRALVHSPAVKGALMQNTRPVNFAR